MGASNSKSKPWDPASAPDLRGKTALVTGANSGLGLETAKRLAERGATVVMGCRSQQRAEAAMQELRNEVPEAKVEFLQLDLCSQKSVAAAAAAFGAKHPKLELLVLNAAVMATPFKLTEDGFEEQMAATHFGHFALAGLLMDKLKVSAPARVVTQSSMMHWFSGDMPFDKLNAKRSPWSIYGNAKLANMLFSLELKKRLAAHAPGVMAVTCHPGYTSTGLQLTPGKGPAWLMRGMNWAFAQSVRMGAQPQLYAALGEDIESGDFTGPTGLSKGPAVKVKRAKRATDEAAAAKLWALSAKLTGVDYLA